MTTYEEQRDALSDIERSHLTALESLPHELVMRQLDRPGHINHDDMLPGVEAMRDVWQTFISGLPADRAEAVRQAARL